MKPTLRMHTAASFAIASLMLLGLCAQAEAALQRCDGVNKFCCVGRS
jgi:hypothetical protein